MQIINKIQLYKQINKIVRYIGLLTTTIVITLFLTSCNKSNIAGLDQSLMKPDSFTVYGVAVYNDPIALASSAKTIVKIVDISVLDGTMPIVAEQTINSSKSPIKFQLAVPKSKLKANHRYAIEGKIVLGDTLIFITKDVDLVRFSLDRVKLNDTRQPIDKYLILKKVVL